MLRKILYVGLLIGLVMLSGRMEVVAAEALPDAATAAPNANKAIEIEPVTIQEPKEAPVELPKAEGEKKADGITPETIEIDELPEKERKFNLDAENSDAKTSTSKKKLVEKEDEGPLEFKYESFDKDQMACPATPYVETSNRNLRPTKKGNNLRQKQGSPLIAGGSFVLIRGRVADENCLPIQGAAIEIWQADKLGNYEWDYEQKSYWKEPLKGRDENFMFSGTAQTDNLGRFDFFTIMPGAKDQGAPHINIVVKRSGYNNLHTRMYFAGNANNATDHTLSIISEEDKKIIVANGRNINPQSPYAGMEFLFPIILRGVSPYKRF